MGNRDAIIEAYLEHYIEENHPWFPWTFGGITLLCLLAIVVSAILLIVGTIWWWKLLVSSILVLAVTKFVQAVVTRTIIDQIKSNKN